MTLCIFVACGNDECPKFGDVFNKIIFHDSRAADQVHLLLDSWGQGSESKEDYCGSCGELGIAYAEPDSTGESEGQ